MANISFKKVKWKQLLKHRQLVEVKNIGTYVSRPQNQSIQYMDHQDFKQPRQIF